MEEKKSVKIFKKMRHTIKIIIKIILGIAFLAILFFYFGPPYLRSPAITYAEFPFKLEYEIDGERKIIEDAWIVKYTGSIRKIGKGEFRQWNTSLKSKNVELILYEKDNVQIIFELDTYPNYYMGEVTMSKKYVPYIQFIKITYEGEIKKGNKSKKEKMGEYDLFHDYQFEWINQEFPDPIVNDFSPNTHRGNIFFYSIYYSAENMLTDPENTYTYNIENQLAKVNLKYNKLDASKYTKRITTYIVKGELLTSIIGLNSALGNNIVKLPTQKKLTIKDTLGVERVNPKANHSMESVISALKEVGY